MNNPFESRGGLRAWSDCVAWERDRLCPDTLWPGQEACHKGAIIEAIDCAQHTSMPRHGLRRLESFEVAISVTADAIDHMMKESDQ